MKILHTSDWHLGHKLYNYDRKEEQVHFVKQIATIAKEHQPDAMVICGDIFDTALPGIDVQTMFVEALLSIREQCKTMEIVVTAGNHDSYSRLEIDKKLWNFVNIHIIGNVSSDYQNHIIKVGNQGFIAAVPYCSERNFPPVPDNEAGNRQSAFFQGLLHSVATLNSENLPVVLTAHLAVKGCNTTGHKVEKYETTECVGGLEYATTESLGNGYDYLALGHIHHPQWLDKEKRSRYCGTPIAVSFDEAFEHSVSMIEISEHGAVPQCTTLPITELRPAITLPNCQEGTSFESAVELLKEQLDKNVYVRLNIIAEQGANVTECNLKLQEILQNYSDLKCRFCLINLIQNTVTTKIEELPNKSIEELRDLSPKEIVEIAHQYHPLSQEEQDLLTSVIKAVNQEFKNV